MFTYTYYYYNITIITVATRKEAVLLQMGDGSGHTAKHRRAKRSLVFVNKKRCASSSLRHLTLI